ncbi:MAG: glycosyltransferase family 4 protein [Anaerolineales bacterium]|nr:glycosyltransferase family 4 protein [Anaerolineales bacterium]
MAACPPRVAGALVGDMRRDPGARVKYGYFFEALSARFPLVDVYDASLRGGYRYWNALRSFYPDGQRWRERFYKNVPAFRLRSRLAQRHLRQAAPEADVVLQVGVLFDARWQAQGPPSIIYTDYTAHLTAQRPSSGRSPFSAAQLRAWLALERDAFAHASHVCTRSHLVRQSIVQDYGISPHKVSVVGGGINFARLPTPVAARDTAAPTVLFIGKELYRKGGDLLLEAFAAARRQVPGARLRMVTAGPVPACAVRAGVELIRPTWERAEIARLYREADVFVLPSRLETWGDVLLEAMSFALPCIGVTGQAMEEILAHEETGLIVPAENVPALADGLVRLLRDAPLRARLGRRARQRAARQYSWAEVVRRLAACVHGVVKGDDHGR